MPEWFPWVAQIVVPSLLGIATLTVSIVSLLIEVRTHGLSSATARHP